MFVKPFRIKSNVAVRGSEKKRLRTRASSFFTCHESEDKVSEVVSNKDEITTVKIYLHKGEAACIYCVNKSPLLFEYDGTLCPTMYFMWKHNTVIPLLTTHQPVISKLSAGADLMLPGVVFPTNAEFPVFHKGDVVSVTAEGNTACLAVGISLMSSSEMLASEDKRGKAVQILHTFGDHLWAMGEKTQPPQTSHGCHDETSVNVNGAEGDRLQSPADQDNSNVESAISESMKAQLLVSDAESQDCTVTADANCEETLNAIQETLSPEDEMNELLQMCFLSALKTRVKDKDLPVLTSSFYRLHVLPMCPSDKQLDIKKTSYKKLSRYLSHLTESGLIQVKELSKGSDSIVSVNRGHELLRFFKVPSSDVTEEISDTSNTECHFGVITQKEYEPPELITVYGVNGMTMPFFQILGVPKKAVLTSAEVRKLVTDYARDEELIKGRIVVLDPPLHDALCGKDQGNVTEMSWEELFKKLLSRMQLHHQMKFRGMEPIVRKGEPSTITVSVQTRTGNKKVTLVKNLEGFLIDPQEFADKIRKTVQASTSLSPLPTSTPTKPLCQVLIQGNQIRAVESILTGAQYKIPRKYLRGLENAPKKKGKQKN